MLMMRRVLAIPALVLLAGCSNRAPELPGVVPMKGKALLASGEPITAGRLIFSPKEGLGGIEPFADLEKDGSFTITTYQLHDGCVPGQYTVSLSPYAFKGTSPTKLPSPPNIPSRYLSSANSDLVVDITPQSNPLTVKFKDR
jgi:hypothetical protein